MRASTNIAGSRQLREVTNARMQMITREIAVVRLLTERARSLALPAAYGGRSARTPATGEMRKAVRRTAATLTGTCPPFAGAPATYGTVVERCFLLVNFFREDGA